MNKDLENGFRFNVTLNVGIVYRHLKDYSKGREYLENALRLAVEDSLSLFLKGWPFLTRFNKRIEII